MNNVGAPPAGSRNSGAKDNSKAIAENRDGLTIIRPVDVKIGDLISLVIENQRCFSVVLTSKLMFPLPPNIVDGINITGKRAQWWISGIRTDAKSRFVPFFSAFGPRMMNEKCVTLTSLAE